MYRIGAAIAAVILAGLLALTIWNTFKPDQIIVPTDGVTEGPQDPLPTNSGALATLKERTELQKYRAESGPSPSGAVSSPPKPDPLTGGKRDEPAKALVEQWEAHRDNDWQVLRDDRGEVVGIGPTIPDPRAKNLIKPFGRDFRRSHNEWINFGGGWAIFGFSLLLALFLLLRGRIPLKEGFSGITVERFTSFERANHWMTATSFVMLALTGLILLYGQFYLRPWMGASIYSGVAEYSLYTHIAFTAVFVLGVLVMAAVWTRRNIIDSVDINWIKKGGGFLRNKGPNPPAEKFNAGQKMIFWGVTLGGSLMLASGITLMFPFFWLGIDGLRWVLLIHAAIGLLMIAMIIGHIYIGTVGMVGAIDAMWKGRVDRNWAKEHHEIWFKNEIEPRLEGRESREQGSKRPPRRGGAVHPAE